MSFLDPNSYTVSISPISTQTPSSNTSTFRLDLLSDVQEGTPANNMTLVYNSSTDIYEVKDIDLDGGTF